MEAIRVLSEEIGPRPPCSKAEARAAQWCAARFVEHGYEVDVEEFRSRPSYQAWYAVYLLIAVIGAALIVPMPPVALVLGLAALLLYVRDSEGRPLIRPRRHTSRNVVARTRSTDPPRLIVTAHLDSALSSLAFHPRMVGNLRGSIVALHVALAFVPLLGAAAWIIDVERDIPGGMWLLSGALIAYLVLAAALQVHAEIAMRPVAGANDNASGVEVLLRLATHRPAHTWFVVTGSEESGMLGIQAFIAAHPELAAAHYLNIDSVGSGDVFAASEEGILKARRADPELIKAAETAGAETKPFRLLPTDATVLLGRHRRAMSLLAVDERGLLPNWHWATDVIDNVHPATLGEATRIARVIVEHVALSDITS